MARIAGVDLPKNKQIGIALTYLFGIGRTTAHGICVMCQIKPETNIDELGEPELFKIRELVERDHKVEGDLRREISQNIKRLIDLGAYRGLRHRKGLPVRGQRTHTNARTRKGRRRIAIAKKKKE